MSIHHLPATTNHKLDRLLDAMNSVATRLDNLSIAIHATIKEPADYEGACVTCARVIRYGNACIDISRRVEQQELNNGKPFVTVIDDDVLATFCAECGNRHSNVGTWRKRLQEELGLKEQSVSDSQEETCDKCQCRMPEEGARVTIDLMISQVEEYAESSDGVQHVPIYGETILAFCPACGNAMSRSLFEHAMNELLSEEEASSHS